jgi:putative hydrolase of the HAD superfamily
MTSGGYLNSRLIEIIRENSSQIEPIPVNNTRQTGTIKNIRSIIFDIYGTLLVSGSGDIGTTKFSLKSDTFLNSMLKAGITVLDKQAGQRGLKYYYDEIEKSHKSSKDKGIINPEVIITDIWHNTLARLVQNKLIKTKITKYTKQYAAVYFECASNPVWPMPNIIRVLNQLSARKIVLGIISNAQFYTPLLFEALTNFSLTELGFNSKLIEYSYRNNEAKPSTTMFRSVLKAQKTHFNIMPANTLYIGNDMLNDIYSAKMSGFKTALFAGDTRSLRLRKDDKRVLGIAPDIVITDLIQVLDFID